MVIKALAAQAKPSPTETIRRFLSTSSNYLALQVRRHSGRANWPGEGEFIDPARYRSILQTPARRTGE